MKLHGREIKAPCVEIVVIPRTDGDLVFKAQAVLDYKRFEQLCPKPKPPRIRRRGGAEEDDLKDKGFLKQVEDYATKKNNFLFVESIRATEGLEWSTIDYEKPDTWGNYIDELKASGFCDNEVVRLQNAVLTANSLNEAKLEEALQRFLLQQEEHKNNGLSPKAEQSVTPSGEPVSALG